MAKLRYEIREKETHIEALHHELQVLGEENAGLKDKLLSTPRVRSMNFAAVNLSSPSAAAVVLSSAGSFPTETLTASASANTSDGNAQSTVLTQQSSPDRAESARTPPTNASDKVTGKADDAEESEARQECGVDEIGVVCDSFLSADDYDKVSGCMEIFSSIFSYLFSILPNTQTTHSLINALQNSNRAFLPTTSSTQCCEANSTH